MEDLQESERKVHETMGLRAFYQYDPSEAYTTAGQLYRAKLENPTLMTRRIRNDP